jgi:hypothetical protein
MAIKLPNKHYGHRIYQPFQFQGSTNFSQIGIFGLKIYHLAALVTTVSPMVSAILTYFLQKKGLFCLITNAFLK